MTQNTLNDEIEKEIKDLEEMMPALTELLFKLHPNRRYIPVVDDTNKDTVNYTLWQELVRHSLRHIAEKTVEAVKVERQLPIENDGDVQFVHKRAYNQAVSEQSKKAKEWLG